MNGVMRKKPGDYNISMLKQQKLTRHRMESVGFSLSEASGQPVKIAAFDLKIVQAEKAMALIGGTESEVVVIAGETAGGATGYIITIIPVPVAFGLVDMIKGNDLGTTENLGEMETSTLQKLGNIVGSFLLNSMGCGTGMYLLPTPPMVMIDKIGPFLDEAFADIMADTMNNNDELIALETIFSTRERGSVGTLLVVPSMKLMNTIKEQLKECMSM